MQTLLHRPENTTRKSQQPDFGKIRPAIKSDFDFVFGLFKVCESQRFGVRCINREIEKYFGQRDAIVPLSGTDFDERRYFIIEDHFGFSVGVIVNRRSSTLNKDFVGMIICPTIQAKGLGTRALRTFVQMRTIEGAKEIQGIVAKSNDACIKASERAGGVVTGETVFHADGLDIDCFVFTFLKR
jgi:hypothetical protein